MSAEPSIPPEAGHAAAWGGGLAEPADAAIFETFVVPRYMSLFGDLALEMIVESEDAQVVHLHCRTGYPDQGISARLPGAYVVGLDPSPAALALARAKAAATPELVCQYEVAAQIPSGLPGAAFSHALALHPPGSAAERATLIGECARLLALHGQVVLAMPMRDSFPELLDLLREYSLKYDDFAVGQVLERASADRPSLESLGAELMEGGFDFIEDAMRPAVLTFRSGRDFFEDPITRLLILPDLRAEIGPESADAALRYVRDAIDKYWSDSHFELRVNVGCVSGRRESVDVEF